MILGVEAADQFCNRKELSALALLLKHKKSSKQSKLLDVNTVVSTGATASFTAKAAAGCPRLSISASPAFQQ